ncbi:histone H3-4 isoform X2 [Hydra vulgaris]|uniref:Histone H3-4 isoform X2 n=1 Tax=Hydra vulgaris TaxID=6087 RepID=A0ABM4BCH2_HYDVU
MKSKNAAVINGKEIKLKTPKSTSTPMNKEKKRKSDSPLVIANKKRRNIERSGNNTINNETPNKTTSKSRNDTTTHRRIKPGIKALKEIRYYQKTDHLLIPKLSFCRVVKEIIISTSKSDFRIQSQALAALQEATEAFMVRYMQDANMCAIHANRVTIQPKDMKLVAYFDKHL